MSIHLEPDPQVEPPVAGVVVETGVEPFGESGPVRLGPPPADALVRVTAVLVAHDGAAFLPRTLRAVAAQTRPPDRLVAVDAGSRDDGPALLAPAVGRVLRLNRDTSFGDAVQAALTTLDATGLAPAPEPRPIGDPPIDLRERAADGPVVDWLWLLHDDSAPAPEALARLIAATDGGPSIGIAGCKQVSWDDDRRLLEVGFTTSRLGARVTGIDDDDIDQGQLDHRSDVLAVGTAGMLVRRDVWDSLGGTDPALAHARDDLDLCRRAHLAGVRVVVVPRAVVAHAAATASGRRHAGRATWALRDRRAAVHLRLATVPLPLLPGLLLWLAAAAVLRAAGRLVLKQPDRAASELAAFGLALTSLRGWARARRRVRHGRRLPRRDYRRLLAGPGFAARQRRDAISAYLRRADEAEPGDVPADGPDDGPDDAHDDRRPAPTPAGEPVTGSAAGFLAPPGTAVGLAVTVLAATAGLVGLRPLLAGTGTPLGPSLLPPPATAGELWRTATSGWRPVGLGQPGSPDPFDTLLTLLAGPLGGSPRAAAEALLLAALPAAALLAWWSAGGVTRSRALRAWAAIVWAAAPALLAAVASGRLAAIVAHLALPPLARALARALGVTTPERTPGRRTLGSRRGRGSISAASGAGLVLTVLLAAAPALTVPAVVVLVALAVVPTAGRRLLGWVVAVPAVLLLPWWMAVAREPGLLLAEPGGPGPAAAPAGGWSALWPPALWPTDPGTGLSRVAELIPAGRSAPGGSAAEPAVLALALALPLLVLGLSALVRPGRRRAAAVLWGSGLTGLAVAVAVGLDPQLGSDGPLTGWPGPGLSLLTLAIVAAALVRLDGAAGRLRHRSVGPRHWLAVGSGVLVVMSPLALLVGWSVEGWSAGPARWVHRGAADVLPAVAAAEAEGPGATRTLVLAVDRDVVRWSLQRSGGPRIGAESAASRSATQPPSAGRPVPAAVGGLLSGAGRDQRDELSDLAVGSVLLLPPVRADVASALDSAPGLVPVATVDGARLWRVELAGSGPTRPARVRVLSADNQVLQVLPSDGTRVRTSVVPGPAGRLLVLAERADPGWRADLGGTPLVPVTHAGWAQAFQLPAEAGPVTVRFAGRPDAATAGTARLVVAGLALLLAVPLPRRRRGRRPISRPTLGATSGPARGPMPGPAPGPARSVVPAVPAPRDEP